MADPVVTVAVLNQDRFNADVDAVAEKLMAALLPAMHVACINLQAAVRENYLQGQVSPGIGLEQRTGTLSRSIVYNVVKGPESVHGQVGTNVWYGRIHEMGGVVQVPQHSRVQTMAFGRPMTPRAVQVKAHPAKYPQRAFLVPAYEAMKAQITELFRKTIKDAAARGLK